MQFGTIAPKAGSTDASGLRDYARALEGAGFDYMTADEHVTGAHPDRFAPGAFAPHNHESPFHDIFVLFSYLSAVTTELIFVPSIVILPQLPTALVAKQATELDRLSGGRLRFAVGIGYNEPEFESLGADFYTRARRMEEQITVLRKLWSEPLVTFKGRWHDLDRVAIAPRSPRPLKIWIGCGAGERQLRRVAKMADGWIALLRPTEEIAEAVGRLHHYIDEAGRDPAEVGIEGRIGPVADLAEAVEKARLWQSLGATHLTLRNAPAGSPPMQMLEAAQKMKEVIREAIEV
jgi:probable F420-dependent oxidoreductase